MTIAPCLLALLGLHAAPPPLPAQERQLVSGEVACATCRITLDTVATIGGLDGPGLHVVFRFSRVAVDRLGRIIVSDIRQPEFSVFEADGTFLRTVGRMGDGPGEYRHVDWVNVGPQYIHVWTIRADANILSRWSMESRPRLTGEFQRRVKAFDDDAPDGNTFPSSRNRGLMLDPDGLWLVWTTPDPDWTRRSPAGTPSATVPPRLEHDGWVDLIDPETGLTIALHHTDGYLLGFAKGSRYVVAYHETDEGVPCRATTRVGSNPQQAIIASRKAVPWPLKRRAS